MAVTKRIGLALTLISVIAHSAKLIAEACDGNANHAPHFHGQDETGQEDRNLLEYIRRDDYLWSNQKEFEQVGARCMTEEADENDIAVMARIFENMPIDLRTDVIQIPLYIHVLENEDGDGAVSDVQINDQVDVLNAAFGPEIQYVLQEKIITVNNEWHRCELGKSEKVMKSKLRRGGPETLNIYLCVPVGGLLGWATYPTKYEGNPTYDGVVAHTESIPGGRQAPYNLGNTAVHETGHWLGLRHTFQGGCSAKGDAVTDTPAESSPAYGCPVGRDSCKDDEGEDPINNFMDYSDDSCMAEFTPGQTAVMTVSYIKLRAVPGSINAPSRSPSGAPSASPSHSPSFGPSNAPSRAPSGAPSAAPSSSPSTVPSASPAISPSDKLSQQSETTGSNNADDGSEPSGIPPKSNPFGSSTSDNISTGSPQNSNIGAFSTIFGGVSQTSSASSGNSGGSGFVFPQKNSGTSASQGNIFGSFSSGGSFGSGGGGGGGQGMFLGGLGNVAPTAPNIFAPSSVTANTADSETCTSLKAKGGSCREGFECCSGVCAGLFFFTKKCT